MLTQKKSTLRITALCLFCVCLQNGFIHVNCRCETVLVFLKNENAHFT